MDNNEQKDPQSLEAIEARANQEDPIAMYLIVRETLEMSIGKTAAQVGHAVQMLQLKYQEFNNQYELPMYLFDIINIYNEWLNTSFRKIVLKADEKEWSKLKGQLKDQIVIVIDNGLTELVPQTETVIGVFPMYKSKCPKIIKRLQVLK